MLGVAGGQAPRVALALPRKHGGRQPQSTTCNTSTYRRCPGRECPRPALEPAARPVRAPPPALPTAMAAASLRVEEGMGREGLALALRGRRRRSQVGAMLSGRWIRGGGAVQRTLHASLYLFYDLRPLGSSAAGVGLCGGAPRIALALPSSLYYKRNHWWQGQRRSWRGWWGCGGGGR